ncbi:hypothetical protein KGA66_25945 [Actinocrinis puniceicyclus]|uniref:Uncharacterized protein n=1 Tax=Actinocrinis puniceicyclus TaxID=977794 RepID=A0A8J7WUS5_9ACTN|nr:hypothetical protein [Actinocrinis puniceicyclus]
MSTIFIYANYSIGIFLIALFVLMFGRVVEPRSEVNTKWLGSLQGWIVAKVRHWIVEKVRRRVPVLKGTMSVVARKLRSKIGGILPITGALFVSGVLVPAGLLIWKGGWLALWVLGPALGTFLLIYSSGLERHPAP